MAQAIDAEGGGKREPRLLLGGELVRGLTTEDCLSLIRALEGVAAARDAAEACSALVRCEIGAREIAAASLSSVELERGELTLLARSGSRRTRRRTFSLSAPTLLSRAAQNDELVEREPGAPSSLTDDQVALPLRADGQLVGVLGLSFPDEKILSRAERALLLLLGTHLGPGVRRLCEAEQHRERTRALESISRRLHGTARISRELAEAGHDEREILSRTARGVAETFGDACFVRMLSDGSRLETVAVHHVDESAREHLERFADSLTEEPTRRSLTTKRGILMRRVHRRAADAPVRKNTPTSSLMSAPIELDGTACGAILAVRERGSAYQEEDRLLLEDVAYRVGLALARARAFSAEQEARLKAELAARGRDRVLWTVSHDLRAPLATVHLGASLLADIGAEHESHAEIVARITRATRRMRRLVEDLLDLGQIESGVLRVKRCRVSLCRVLEETVDELSERARRAGKELACGTAVPNLDVLGDFERIQQVLVNLVTNAIDHTPAGTWIVVGAEKDGDHAWIWVEDDGPGLDPSLAQSLFEPHVRGSNTLARGAGLGLWVAKGLVEALGGQLRLSSPRGKGTRFELSLPIAPSET